MSSKSGGIVVEITTACELEGVDVGRIEDVVMHICERFSIESGTVGIAIVDDEGILKVNEQFLDSSAMTDVISFDLSDEDDGAKTFELVVNYDEAVRQGEVRAHTSRTKRQVTSTRTLRHPNVSPKPLRAHVPC